MIANRSPLFVATESMRISSNTTGEPSDGSSSVSSTIITIVILSLLSVFGWIFMSYALFGRSEAYRSKPDDHFVMSPGTTDHHRSNRTDVIADFDSIWNKRSSPDLIVSFQLRFTTKTEEEEEEATNNEQVDWVNISILRDIPIDIRGTISNVGRIEDLPCISSSPRNPLHRKVPIPAGSV